MRSDKEISIGLDHSEELVPTVLEGYDNPGFDCSMDIDDKVGTDSTISTESGNAWNGITHQNGKSANGPRQNPVAVVVRNANKAYHSGVPVLAGYNMTVEKGTIYGLLGSSGCGKTTILSCIVGVRQLDSGTIHVFGRKPGTKGSGFPGKLVGYMPQDLSLYDDFTIGETLVYFGSLYCMTKSAIDDSKKRLGDILALPDSERQVGTLSGGQKRRVSIAVAMIHNPPLLILDEPTVGVHSLLRESIWKYLIERVTEDNTTIIITTHYIEESKQSDKIGVMRNGRLLAEKSPQDLMREYDAALLDDVVLKLCRRDKQTSEMPDVVSGDTYENSEQLVHSSMATILDDGSGHSFMPSVKRVLTLVHKNALLLIRNYLLLIFIILVPASQIMFVCLAIGNDPKNLAFGVVNHEFDSNGVANCSELLELRENETCSLIGLSCEYLQAIPKNIVIQRFYDTEQLARHAVLQGEVWGVLTFPPGFSSAYYEKLADSVLADKEIFNSSLIALEMDETNLQITGSLMKYFVESFTDFTKTFLTRCGYSASLGELPLQIVDPVYGSDETDAREYMMAGIMVAILFFFPLVTAAVQYIYEKKLGTMERALVAGVNIWEIMVGFSITQSFILLVQTSLVLTIVTVLFQIEIHGMVLLCVVLGILVGLGGLSLGFLIGRFCKEEVEATMLSIAMFFPMIMLSGIVWPLEGMPKGFQYFSYIIPCQLTSESMRSIISRGWDLSHPNVWPGFLSMGGWIIVYWLMNIFLHKDNLSK